MSSEVKGIFGMTTKCTCMQTHKKMNIEHVEVSTQLSSDMSQRRI